MVCAISTVGNGIHICSIITICRVLVHKAIALKTDAIDRTSGSFKTVRLGSVPNHRTSFVDVYTV